MDQYMELLNHTIIVLNIYFCIYDINSFPIAKIIICTGKSL